MIDMLAPIAVATEDLESRREIVAYKPSVHIRSIPGIYFLAMLRSVIINVIHGKKHGLSFSATNTNGTIMLKNQSPEFGSLGFNGFSGSLQFTHPVGVILGPSARIGGTFLARAKSILSRMATTNAKTGRYPLGSNALVIFGSRLPSFLKLFSLMSFLPASLRIGTSLAAQPSRSSLIVAIYTQSQLLVSVILAFLIFIHVLLLKGGGHTAWNSPR